MLARFAEMDCQFFKTLLDFRLDNATLFATFRKPSDVYVEGLIKKDSRGEMI